MSLDILFCTPHMLTHAAQIQQVAELFELPEFDEHGEEYYFEVIPTLTPRTAGFYMNLDVCLTAKGVLLLEFDALLRAVRCRNRAAAETLRSRLHLPLRLVNGKCFAVLTDVLTHAPAAALSPAMYQWLNEEAFCVALFIMREELPRVADAGRREELMERLVEVALEDDKENAQQA